MAKDDMETECMNELFGNNSSNKEEPETPEIHWHPVSNIRIIQKENER